jgi:hypothetical protein
VVLRANVTGDAACVETDESLELRVGQPGQPAVALMAIHVRPLLGESRPSGCDAPKAEVPRNDRTGVLRDDHEELRRECHAQVPHLTLVCDMDTIGLRLPVPVPQSSGRRGALIARWRRSRCLAAIAGMERTI